MNFSIICVGKLKEKYLREACAEYEKRLGRFGKVQVIEVADFDCDDPCMRNKVLEREAELISRHIKDSTYLVTLCVEGKQLSSEELAAQIRLSGVEGVSHMTFVIGGSIGIAEYLKEKSDFKLSFSRMTFPHQLMRVILLEQIYRACKINSGESYHK